MSSIFLPSWRHRALYVGLVAALLLSVYGRSLGNAFVEWDDHLLILNNPIVHELNATSLKAAFTSYDPELYIPLTFVSYQINHATAGQEPWIYHATNLLLHFFNVLLVGCFIFALTGRTAAAVIVSFLFAVHPLHTEAVAWASARKDLLSSTFLLLTVAMYLRYAQSHAKKWLVLSLFAFLCGLLSKVSIALLPLALLLIDWHQHRRIDRTAILEKLPLAALSVIFIIVALVGKETGGAFLWEKLLIGSKAAVFYLSKLFLPYGLSVLYPYTKPITLVTPDLLLSLLLVIGLTGLAVYLRTSARMVTFAWVWYLLFLLPTFTTIAKGHDELQDVYFASDRYVYIASVGIFLLVGLIISELHRQSRKSVEIGVSIAILLLSVVAYHQSRTWQNTETLFRNVLRFYPNAHAAHSNVGTELFRRGKVEEAMVLYKASLSVRPNGLAYYNIGQIHLMREENEEAIDAFRNAIASSPIDTDSYFYLSGLLINRMDYKEAVEVVRAGISIDANIARLWVNLGLALEHLGDKTGALSAFQKALVLDPENVPLQQTVQELGGSL